MERSLRLLFLEDSLLDVELCVRELERAGYKVDYEVVQNEGDFLRKIGSQQYDVVLADYNLPGFGGMDALREFRAREIDKPFLIISGSIGEETAVESLKAGANDYVLKDRLVRLPSAVEQAVENWRIRVRQRQAEEALRETNETLQALIQASPLAIIVLDSQGRVHMWNDAAERMFGWRADEVVGSFLPFVPDDKREEFQALRDRVLGGDVLANVEIHRRRKDGSPIDLSLSTAPLRDADGRVCNIVAVVADITERKQTEQARREMEKRLDEAKRLFYRETILAVTDGKLEIVDMPDLLSAFASADVSLMLEDADQLGPARREIKRFCEEHGLKGDRLGDFVLGVGEAMTNALKHGMYGHVYAGRDGDQVWVAVSDRGHGIDALILPGATLRRGYSTKPSLGLGYSVILNVCDYVKLNTGPHGTSVLMQKFLKEPAKEPLLEIFPDLW